MPLRGNRSEIEIKIEPKFSVYSVLFDRDIKVIGGLIYTNNVG